MEKKQKQKQNTLKYNTKETHQANVNYDYFERNYSYVLN